MFQEKFITAHLAKKFNILSLKNSDDHFFSHHPLLRCCALYREIISLTTIFKILPQNLTLYLPKNLLTFFFTHRPFFPFSWTIFYIFLLTDHNSYFLSFYTPHIYYIYCFFAFLQLALCSRNNK